MRLESWFVASPGSPGALQLRLVNTGPDPIADFELTFTTIVQLEPLPPAQLRERVSGCHVVAPPEGFVLGPGEVWAWMATCGHRPRHAVDGPASAFVTAGGVVHQVAVGTTRRIEGGEVPATTYRADGELAAAALDVVAARDGRLHPHRVPVLSSTGERLVTAAIDEAMPAESYRLAPDRDGWSVTAGSSLAVERALTGLVRAARSGAPVVAGESIARHGWRGLHVDLARRFFPAADVDWLVDVAAWHGLNRLHLHLSDDEGWRFPVPGHDQLTSGGAFRGRGRAVPPLLGSGPEPYGGAYDAGDIAGWHRRAEPGGVVIIPEIDLPGHCFAALAALPELRDPADTSGARSIQSFVDNVLNPGVDATWPFLEAVFGALADAFPSPWLHVGGDEVAPRAWTASPAAQRWAEARGIDGSAAIERTFLREVVALVRRLTGRRVGVWEEGAAALEPGDGYAVGWTSAEACQRLAAAGHDVVAAPAARYYLDMATSREWDDPGASWAGTTSAADIAAFDPAADWSVAERDRLLGRPGLPLDRARPRPPDDRTPPLPPPHRLRRRRLAPAGVTRAHRNEVVAGGFQPAKIGG